MKSTTQEIFIKGIPICRGIAIGKSFFYDYVQDAIPEFTIQADEIEKEILHYRQAIKRSEEEVRCLKKQLEQDGAHDGAAILDGHLEMMQDPLLTVEIEQEIRSVGKNAEFVFSNSISQYQKKFSTIADPFFRERFRDLLAISRRILGYMRNTGGFSFTNIPHNSVVFAHELAASDSAEAKSGAVSAFVTQHGGVTSHAAIVAKAKGIPYVADVNFNLFKHHKNSLVIVDGRTGDIVINPSTETLQKYQTLQSQLFDHFRRLEKAGELQAETIDGYQVGLLANIDMLNELDLVHQYGGDGVGLFRSEYIFLSKDHVPHEEEQFEIYKVLIERMRGRPVTIRTFDIGGDKLNLGRALPQEGNPFLGCRAIRFLLKERKIFKTQLRAILRASAYGEVKILFPMISNLSEFLEVKKIVREALDELEQSGVKNLRTPQLGCMVEVPSAAVTADLLARECDFLSIGTNDLVQYSLAVDRDNQSISGLYNPAHPCIIRLIKMVCDEANRYGIPVTICGEVASDPRFTPLLIGLGAHQLSVSSRHIPIVKNAIRSTYILSATHLAEKVLTLSTAQEIQQILNEEYQKNVPDDYFYNC